jgi:DNA polymerase
MVSEKTSALLTLTAKIAADKSLPLREANLVFGEGSPDAQILFIGEAPGANEDREGRPFVGRAGKLLRGLIRELNWEENDVYITNIVKRRPPENRDPTPEEIAAYKPYLAEQIRIIHPKIIATLGRFSMNYFLPDAKISRDHGKLFLLRDILLFPLYHPAAALRATSMKMELEKDFRKLPQILKAYDSLVVSTRKETE